jgi:hypothetical protein
MVANGNGHIVLIQNILYRIGQNGGHNDANTQSHNDPEGSGVNLQLLGFLCFLTLSFRHLVFGCTHVNHFLSNYVLKMGCANISAHRRGIL